MQYSHHILYSSLIYENIKENGGKLIVTSEQLIPHMCQWSVTNITLINNDLQLR
jgi:hypothetical protein